MSILHHRDILELQQAAIRAQLINSRAALLSGINSAFVAGMPTTPTPGAQILTDLAVLNAVLALINRTVPLLIWLSNAIVLAGPREESYIFQQALDNARDLLPFSLRQLAPSPAPQWWSPAGTEVNSSSGVDSKQLVFAEIRMDATNPGWESVTALGDPFGRDCKTMFSLNMHRCNVDPCFDVTIVNRSTEPTILTDVGVEIVAVASRSYICGMPAAVKIKRSDSYSVEIPAVSTIATEGDEVILDLNMVAKTKTHDPIYLEPKAPYRYSLLLNRYHWHIPNHAILRLWVRSTGGVDLSDDIHLHSAGVSGRYTYLMDNTLSKPPHPPPKRNRLRQKEFILRANQVWTGTCTPGNHEIRLVVTNEAVDSFCATIEHLDPPNETTLVAGHGFSAPQTAINKTLSREPDSQLETRNASAGPLGWACRPRSTGSRSRSRSS